MRLPRKAHPISTTLNVITLRVGKEQAHNLLVTSIAICGIGHDQDKSRNTLWHVAAHRLIEEKKPTTLIIYGGKQENYLKLPVKVKYIPDFINQHLRIL